MCLAIPAKVVEVKGQRLVVAQGDLKREVLKAVDAKPGEYVLLQQGMAVEKIGEKEALETIRLWNESEKN